MPSADVMITNSLDLYISPFLVFRKHSLEATLNLNEQVPKTFQARKNKTQNKTQNKTAINHL